MINTISSTEERSMREVTKSNKYIETSHIKVDCKTILRSVKPHYNKSTTSVWDYGRIQHKE